MPMEPAMPRAVRNARGGGASKLENNLDAGFVLLWGRLRSSIAPHCSRAGALVDCASAGGISAKSGSGGCRLAPKKRGPRKTVDTAVKRALSPPYTAAGAT